MPQKKTKVAAIGDIHITESDKGKWGEFFRTASAEADVLILAGDLTNTGHPAEAQILKEELSACTIPVVAVLGNHDHDRELQDEITEILADENFHILDGDSIIIGNLGIAGIKGFGGGFDGKMLSMFGEKMWKDVVQHTVDDTLKLDAALSRLESEHPELTKVVVLHYAPIKETLKGEPEEIFPFMGCSRLAEPIIRREISAVFHGHAHIGALQGKLVNGTTVYNVSKPVLQMAQVQHGFYLLEV